MKRHERVLPRCGMITEAYLTGDSQVHEYRSHASVSYMDVSATEKGARKCRGEALESGHSFRFVVEIVCLLLLGLSAYNENGKHFQKNCL